MYPEHIIKEAQSLDEMVKVAGFFDELQNEVSGLFDSKMQGLKDNLLSRMHDVVESSMTQLPITVKDILDDPSNAKKQIYDFFKQALVSFLESEGQGQEVPEEAVEQIVQEETEEAVDDAMDDGELNDSAESGAHEFDAVNLEDPYEEYVGAEEGY